MHNVTVKLRLAPNTLDELVLSNWKPLVRSAATEILNTMTRYRRKKQYAPTIEQVPEGRLFDALSAHGYLIIGQWQYPNMLREDQEQAVLLHWPSMARLFPFYMHAGPGYEALAYVFWGMADIIKRRSPLLHELLHRKFVHGFSTSWEPDEHQTAVDWTGVPPLTEYEESLLAKLQANARRDEELWKAFSSVFMRTLGACTKATPLLRQQFYHRVKKEHRHEFSFFRIGKYRKMRSYTATAPRVDKLSERLFAASKVGPELRELMVMRHLPRDEQGETGLRLDDVVYPERQMRVVNMARYSTFRTRAGADLYEKLVRQLGERSSLELVGNHAAEFVHHFESRYPELKLPPGAYGEYAEFIEEHWPGTRTYDHFLFFPANVLPKRLAWTRRMEKVRKSGGTKTISMPRTKPAPKEVYMPSPPIAEAEGEVFDIYAIRLRTRVLFRVPWLVSPKVGCKHVGDDGDVVTDNPIPAKGVHVHIETGRWYYPYHILYSDTKSPLRSLPALDSWLKAHKSLTRAQFNQLRKRVKNERVNPQERIDAHREKGTLRGMRYKDEEDDVIRRLYRPHMSDKDKATIMQTCMGRDWNNIQRRAAVLCDKLLEQGIYDLRQLPHRNYNATLRRKVEKAMRKAKKDARG